MTIQKEDIIDFSFFAVVAVAVVLVVNACIGDTIWIGQLSSRSRYLQWPSSFVIMSHKSVSIYVCKVIPRSSSTCEGKFLSKAEGIMVPMTIRTSHRTSAAVVAAAVVS